MKRLKTPLRNTMTDDRLSSLAKLHIHKEEEINVKSVLDQFAQHKERRRLEDPQPKQCFVCAPFAQNKGKTLCSLFVFTQLFRTRNKKTQNFSLSSLRFLDHMYSCVIEKMTTLRAYTYI